jgi:hypothetical protein
LGALSRTGVAGTTGSRTPLVVGGVALACAVVLGAAFLGLRGGGNPTAPAASPAVPTAVEPVPVEPVAAAAAIAPAESASAPVIAPIEPSVEAAPAPSAARPVTRAAPTGTANAKAAAPRATTAPGDTEEVRGQLQPTVFDR